MFNSYWTEIRRKRIERVFYGRLKMHFFFNSIHLIIFLRHLRWEKLCFSIHIINKFLRTFFKFYLQNINNILLYYFKHFYSHTIITSKYILSKFICILHKQWLFCLIRKNIFNAWLTLMVLKIRLLKGQTADFCKLVGFYDLNTKRLSLGRPVAYRKVKVTFLF